MLPLRGVPQDRLTALGVERFDAVFGDGSPAGDTGFLFGLHLRRETVAVPTEVPFDLLAAHSLEPGDDVLDIARE